MIKPLIVDLALPLYAELPNYEAKPADIESDFESSTVSEAHSGTLEVSLQKKLPSSEESTTLYICG
ncbi:MAG TPA: hypothetical protein VFG30_14620 [Polyangiales bacterium]|nr:hypothetical protein [Polyangiales bacterium]